MEERMTYRTDRQITSVLSITVWINLVCIALLVAVNAINYFRGLSRPAEEGAQRLLSPELLLILSIACVLWLLVRVFSARRVARRVQNVFLLIDGGTVSGVSLAEPSAPSRDYPDGRPFTLQVNEITEVFSKEVLLVKKQPAPALCIRTADDCYVLPALERLPEAKSYLLRLMGAASEIG